MRVTIPTLSNLEGNKSASYTYTLYTDNVNEYKILRNYIYTLNIIVIGQELDPLLSLDVKPWDDAPVSGNIGGTYLTLDQTELKFNSSGVALINFCSDAQAIYFDFTDFNLNNPATPFGVGGAIKPINIDTTRANFPLAPTGYQDAQILLDKQHCGSFGFQLDLSKFPTFPIVTFSGQICMKAGNIVKCLTFPASLIYDAHFIVGDSIFPGELFTNAVVSSGSNWMEVSPDRLYTTNASAAYTGTERQIYLHLNENLTANARTGNITLANTNTGVNKIINITQLPALRVGAFGFNPLSTVDDTIFTAQLYTEQLYEFTTMPAFMPLGGNQVLPGNALYNGRYSALSVFDLSNYNNIANYFNYQASVYAAINYCAYKNRDENKNGNIDPEEIKWYLPSQAQLLGMWITYESYKKSPYSNFYRNGTSADIFWSSTDNIDYRNPSQAQTVSFLYGNVGHYNRTQPYWVRCVRDVQEPSNLVIRRDTTGYWAPLGYTGSLDFPQLEFSNGLPVNVYEYYAYYSFLDKVDSVYNESDDLNKTVYASLRVANFDLDGGALLPWDLNLCDNYHLVEPTTIGNPNGKWRLPSQRELQAIWAFQYEMKQKCPSFNLLSDYYYWSGTNASTTNGSNAWTVYGNGSRTLVGGSGNTPHQIKSQRLKVRCVIQYMGP